VIFFFLPLGHFLSFRKLIQFHKTITYRKCFVGIKSNDKSGEIGIFLVGWHESINVEVQDKILFKHYIYTIMQQQLKS
jgi:hypothetical protein